MYIKHFNSMKKPAITLILAAAVISFRPPYQTSATEHAYPAGHKTVDVKIHTVTKDEMPAMTEEVPEGKTDYPAKVDPRQEPWYKDIIEVRDQADSNLCWAFSANKAAQISYAKELYEKTGRANDVPEMSPLHTGYFFYNRLNDPLGNTDGDLNLINKNDDSTSKTQWINIGGNVCSTFQHMATWSGLSHEEKTPFVTGPMPGVSDNLIYIGPTNLTEGMTDEEARKLAYDDALVETECTYYQSGTIDDLKAVVSRYGAAVVSLFFGSSNRPQDDIIYNEYNFYNPDGYRSDNNHEVVVVGWDDDYPASNFKSQKHVFPNKDSRKTDEPYEIEQANVSPEANGAWLVMNSWGENWGENGYFWVSYESLDILSDGICGFDMAPADDYAYNFQYDGNSNCYYDTLDKGDKVVNIYTNTTNNQILLDSVGFTTYNDGYTECEVDIYTCLNDTNNPNDGYCAYSMTVYTETPGFKTFPLDRPIGIDPNEKWAVMLTMKNETTFLGVECNDYDYNNEDVDYFKDFYSYKVSTKAGQSFEYTRNTGWEDASEYNLCFRIKTLADNLVCEHSSTQKECTVEPTKRSNGYTIVRCTDCGHTEKTDITTLPSSPSDDNPDSDSTDSRLHKRITSDKTFIDLYWEGNSIYDSSKTAEPKLYLTASSNEALKTGSTVKIPGYEDKIEIKSIKYKNNKKAWTDKLKSLDSKRYAEKKKPQIIVQLKSIDKSKDTKKATAALVKDLNKKLKKEVCFYEIAQVDVSTLSPNDIEITTKIDKKTGKLAIKGIKIKGKKISGKDYEVKNATEKKAEIAFNGNYTGTFSAKI